MGNYTPTSDQIGGIVRALLAAASGWAIGKGYIDGTTAATISGAIGTIVIAAWSYYSNSQTKLIQAVNSDKTNGAKVVREDAPGQVINAPVPPVGKP